MRPYLTFIKVFKWVAIIFILLINIISINMGIQNHNYVGLLSILVISIYILAMLFVINHYFFSMAVSFTADKDNIYLTYYNKSCISVAHSQIVRVKCTPARYIFYLEKGKKLYLTRMIGFMKMEVNINSKIRELYSEKLSADSRPKII